MMPKFMIKVFKVWLPVLVCCLGLVFSAAGHAKQILIISNANDGPYPEVIDGYKKQLAGQLTVTFSALNMAQIKADPALLDTEIARQKPDLIFALGVEAIESARLGSKNTPIVASLTLKNELFNARVTGVSLTYPLSTQVQLLKKFFPHQSKIAVLYNPAENAKLVQALAQIAGQNGFELLAIPVESPKQLPDALEQLAKNSDIFFAIPDAVAMSPNTAKEVLLASFRNRVPLIGLSDNWVKSGALYALSWDYGDLGQQCALQSQKILNGQSILQVAPEAPRKMMYAINTKIAEHMNIEIPDSLLKNAKALFE